jgi:ubiquitin-activating enzyme E1
MFPADYVGDKGIPFWSGTKRSPIPEPYNPADNLHVHFMMATANLIAYNLGIKGSKNKEEIARIAAETHIPEFAPKKIAVTLEEKDKNLAAAVGLDKLDDDKA